MDQIIALYTLNVYSGICKLFLNRTEKRKYTSTLRLFYPYCQIAPKQYNLILLHSLSESFYLMDTSWPALDNFIFLLLCQCGACRSTLSFHVCPLSERLSIVFTILQVHPASTKAIGPVHSPSHCTPPLHPPHFSWLPTGLSPTLTKPVWSHGFALFMRTDS